MKNFIIGLIIGLVLGGSLAWAAGSIIWVDDSGKAMGTESNPIYIQ